ncbi:MAG: ribonuclease III [Verrucomicrobiia bacterium]|tara:strand:- start:547 stop:1281 length:735 start_codon:yes stop_codon:yes gene_type:complete
MIPKTKGEFAPDELQKNISYAFKNRDLLLQALTHPSYNEHDKSKQDNQRMEFLGDSILSAIITEALFNTFPLEDEGSLSRKRAVFIRGSFLAKIASNLKIHDFLIMSKPEFNNKGNRRSSTLEDALEAIIGAIFLDGGMECAKKCVLKWFGDIPKQLELEQPKYNPKGQLQELIQDQAISDKIHYRIIKEEGPAHQKKFAVDLIIGKKTLGTGVGRTKKEAEEEAAQKALVKLSNDVTSKNTSI